MRKHNPEVYAVRLVLSRFVFCFVVHIFPISGERECDE